MKKLIITVLLAALTLGLCACGSSNTQDQATQDQATSDQATQDQATQNYVAENESLKAASEYTASVIDTSEMTSSIQEGENGAYQYLTYTGANANDEFALEIEVDDKSIVLKDTTVSDLKDLGFECETDVETVPPNTIQGFTMKKDGKLCNISVQNTTDKEQDIQDLTVFQVNVFTDEGSFEFNYGGIRGGSSLEEVIKTLGTPKSNVTIAGSENGNSITLNYFNSVTQGELTISSTLDIDLSYNAEKNSATVRSINLTSYQEKAVQETAAE